MYSLYVFNEDNNCEEELLYRTKESTNEYQVIEDFFKFIDKKYTGFRFLGELRGMVYRMNFKLTVDGMEREYMVIHNPNA